jgi:DNA-directed RNA polymerase subunit RPC12/RpoP
MKEKLYWWCDTCEQKVDILVGYSQGLYCQQCGTKVRSPDDISLLTGKTFWDRDDDENEIDISNYLPKR